jgi:hypothetical protein
MLQRRFIAAGNQIHVPGGQAQAISQDESGPAQQVDIQPLSCTGGFRQFVVNGVEKPLDSLFSMS